MSVNDIYGGNLDKVLNKPVRVPPSSIRKYYIATYQDRALNRYSKKFKARCWPEAVRMAFSEKKSEEKLLKIEREVKK